MLDQLGTANVSHQDGRHERFIDFFHQIDRLFALRSDDNAIRLHQVRHCTAFAQKFRIADHIKLCAEPIVSLN